MGTESITKKPIGNFHGIKAEIIYYQAIGEANDTFVLHLPEPRSLLSTRQGFMKAKTVFNCHIPKALGDYMHDQTKEQKKLYHEMLSDVLKEYNLGIDDFAFLSTAVTMDKIAWAEETYEDLWVVAFTTAGVKNNAMRIGRDKAGGIERNEQFIRLGTINTILVTNASFDQAAQASAIIAATEAKNVALQELDIRSAFSPDCLATGTGTDQVIVVSGDGEKCTYVQGHTKIGEMMARAVISSTTDAIRNCAGSAIPDNKQ